MSLLAGMIPPLPAPSGGGGYSFEDTSKAAASLTSDGLLAQDMVVLEQASSGPSTITIGGAAAESIEV